jgi:hypothetical protein
MLTDRSRIALIGTGVWLLPALTFALWVVAMPTPAAPVSWIRIALIGLTLGLGIWVLLLVIIFRGQLPFCSAVVGAAFIVINLAVDVLFMASGGSEALRSHVLESIPTYLLVGVLCVGAGRLARTQAHPSRNSKPR